MTLNRIFHTELIKYKHPPICPNVATALLTCPSMSKVISIYVFKWFKSNELSYVLDPIVPQL